MIHTKGMSICASSKHWAYLFLQPYLFILMEITLIILVSFGEFQAKMKVDNYSKCMSEIEHVKLQLPSNKTLAMCITAFRKFLRITPGMSPANFRYMYKELTGDYSASCNLDQSEFEKRVKGTPIPCESWVRLQFWPKNRHLRSSCHYSGKLDIKFMSN